MSYGKISAAVVWIEKSADLLRLQDKDVRAIESEVIGGSGERIIYMRLFWPEAHGLTERRSNLQSALRVGLVGL